MRKIEPPNPTAEALVDIAEQAAPRLPREARIPMPAPEPEIIGKVPFAKPNNGQLEDPREALARGLLKYDVLRAERDQLEKDLKAARERIHLLEIHISEIEGTRATIESRINSCILERDEAVSVFGELRGVIHAIADICKRYQHKHPEPGDVVDDVMRQVS